MSELYRNPRAWRARIVQVAVWIGVIVMLCIPFMPAAPATPADRVAVGVGAALAIGAAAAVEYFLRRYVVALTVTPAGPVLTTLSTFGEKRTAHARNALRSAGRRHDAAMYPGAPSVDNHWIALQTADGGFAYILDVTPPAAIDEAALERALG